jgi:hypothetical protein
MLTVPRSYAVVADGQPIPACVDGVDIPLYRPVADRLIHLMLGNVEKSFPSGAQRNNVPAGLKARKDVG